MGSGPAGGALDRQVCLQPGGARVGCGPTWRVGTESPMAQCIRIRPAVRCGPWAPWLARLACCVADSATGDIGCVADLARMRNTQHGTSLQQRAVTAADAQQRSWRRTAAHGEMTHLSTCGPHPRNTEQLRRARGTRNDTAVELHSASLVLPSPDHLLRAVRALSY